MTKVKSVLLVAFVVALLIRVFVVEGFIVRGDSMSPTILAGDYVFINKFAYVFGEPKRGDIVITKTRHQPAKVIKRIVVMPGERFNVEDGQVFVREGRLSEGVALEESYLEGDVEWELGITDRELDPQEYFALGDNAPVSIDSRELGFVDKWDIKGRAFGVFRLKGFKYIGL
ncbi:MAG: signal peptidase I [Parcubacteria group bacterium]